MQPNKSVEEVEKAYPEAYQLARRFHDLYEEFAPKFGYETRGDTKEFDPSSPNGRIMAYVCKTIVDEEVNTVLQGVVERVEKQQKEWSIISEKADTIFMTGKPTEDYSLEQAHHDAGYYGNKAEALDVAVSLLNDQIISNEK